MWVHIILLACYPDITSLRYMLLGWFFTLYVWLVESTTLFFERGVCSKRRNTKTIIIFDNDISPYQPFLQNWINNGHIRISWRSVIPNLYTNFVFHPHEVAFWAHIYIIYVCVPYVNVIYSYWSEYKCTCMVIFKILINDVFFTDD